jgi:phosphatidate cytidylyltransferase
VAAAANLAARLGTAALLVPVMIGLILWHQTAPMMIAVILGSLAGLDEYLVMALGGLMPPPRYGTGGSVPAGSAQAGNGAPASATLSATPSTVAAASTTGTDGALAAVTTTRQLAAPPPTGARATRAAALLTGTAFAVAHLFCHGTGDANVALMVLAAAVVVALCVALVELGELAAAAARAAHVLFGITYAVLPLGYLALIRRHDHGAAWVFVVLTVTWIGDSFAFAGGHLLGRHKLYPAVSPGKTIEGAVAGLAGSLAATAVAKLWYLPSLTWLDCVLIALPGNLLGQLGDLCESLIKRGAGVKDSGALLPGHGGVLDRIDALLFVSPYVYAYATWVHPL